MNAKLFAYFLCLQSVCGYSVREDGEPHNNLKDADAAMNLVTAKLKHGFNDPIEIAENSVRVERKFLVLTAVIQVVT